MGIERERRLAGAPKEFGFDKKRAEQLLEELPAAQPGRRTLIEQDGAENLTCGAGAGIAVGRQSLLDRGDQSSAPASEAFLVELVGSCPSLDDFRAQGLHDVLTVLASMHGQRGLMRATLSAASKEQRPVRPTLTSRPAPPDPAGQAMWRAAERRAATLYRHAMDSGEIKLDEPAVAQVLARATGGHPLPTELQREMEREIGIALDRVRIHTDAVATDAARALRAQAFTVGEDIFFADGAYAPETREGRKLLAHELIHVVQARQGRAATRSVGIQVSSPDESLEREADAAAERISDPSSSRWTPIHGAGKGGGAPLPEPVRAQMESSFGVDFSEVRIHQGGEAEELDALAYAQGTDIHFAPSHLDPSSQQGLELLGHELAHVVQQARGHVETTHHANGSAVNADPALEATADALGAQAARGEPAAVGATGGAGGTNVAQRKPASEPPSAGEWVAIEATAGAPVQAKPIQRSGNKKKTYVPHEIKVTRPMTGEEYRQAAMLQLFGGQISGLEWGGIKDSYTPEHSPYTLQVELSLLQRHRAAVSKAKGMDLDDGGGIAGAKENAKEFDSAPPSAEKAALLAEIDKRYYAATGAAPGTKIKPGEPGKAQLWRTIRDEVLFQHRYIANLPPKVKELIKFSVKGKDLTPADYEKLFAIAKKIDAMPVGQVNDYASKVTATTTDLDAFERSVDKYLAEAAARDKDNAERDTVHMKLVGLEEVYRKYQLYKTLAASGSMGAIGGRMPGGGGLVGGGIVASREAEELRQELEVDLKAHGFAGLDDFKAWITRYEQAFEKESVNIALDLLGKFAGKLFKEQERYRDPAQISALHQQLGGMRSAYTEFETNAGIYNEWVRTKDQRRIPGQGHLHPKSTRAEAMEAKQNAEVAKAKAMGQYGDLAAGHPLFQEEGLPDDKKLDKVALAKANEGELGGMLQAQISRRTHDIDEAKGLIEGKHDLIYKMDKLFPQFYAQQGIKPGSIHDLIIQAKMRSDAVLKLVKGLAIAIVAIAIAVVSFGTATPAIVAAGTAGVGAGIGVLQAYESYQEYAQENDLADVGLAKDPSMLWLVLAVAGAALDMAAAVKAVSALGKAAKTLEAGSDLKSFLATVKELEKQGELTASVARAAEKAAAARKGVQDASLELTKTMAGKAYSFPGPLLDPDVYAAVLKLARNAVKSKVYDAEKFIAELRLARTSAKLADLSPQELAKAKEAWEAAKALEAAEGATRARLASQVSNAAKLDKLIEQVGDAAALERLLKVFPEAELDGILAQLKDAKTLVHILDHTGAETGARMIRGWMSEGTKGSAKMNQFLERMSQGVGKQLAETAPVGANAIIIDSNTAIALMKDADPLLRSTMNPGEIARVAEIKALPAGTELRVGNVTVGETGQALSFKGVPLDGLRDSAEYQKVLAKLESVKLGKADGFADRALVADAFFAKTTGGVPKLMTSDQNVVKKLAGLAGIDVNKAGGYPGLLAKYGNAGTVSNGFSVSIEGKSVTVIPVP